MSTVAITRLTSHDAVTFGGVVRSEFIKARTTNAVRGLIIAALICQIVFPILVLLLLRQTFAGADTSYVTQTFHGVGATGASLISLLYGVLGTMVVTADYSCGVINTSFVAAGSKARLAAAKAVVIVAIVAVCAFVGALCAILLSGLFATVAMDAGAFPFTDARTWFPLISMPLACVLLALIGYGLGFILRSSLGAIITLCLIIVFGSMIMPMIALSQQTWAEWICALSPSVVLDLTANYQPSGDPQLSRMQLDEWWMNALAATVWTAIAVAAGYALFRSRPLGAGTR
ncbi:ABC transporter permease subunit [Nanchangia anserum]|uniref:ABC transporter permease subunit n=1 Tax=Nanchangia anserum TaxID=2692125 RepID=UPI001CC7F98A|nr:ABC transporter permease subunit [Nanchangia anserum]